MTHILIFELLLLPFRGLVRSSDTKLYFESTRTVIETNITDGISVINKITVVPKFPDKKNKYNDIRNLKERTTDAS